MKQNNILDDDIVKKNTNYAKQEYSQVINNICFKNKNKNTEQIRRNAITYLAGFYSAKEIKERELRQETRETKRKYYTKISIENLLKNTQGDNILTNNDFKKISFNGSDFKTNMKILDDYARVIEKNNANVEDITNSYFLNLDEYLYNDLRCELNDEINIQKSIQKRKTKINETDDDDREQEFIFTKTKSEDIIGNEKPKKDLNISMHKLFLYNKDLKKNPALEKNRFKQNYLLVGEPGNGKGMLNAYAATIGTELEQTLNNKLNIISINPNSKYQYGPVLKMKKYFQEINNSNELYLVLLDEIDSNFSSRTNTKTQDYTKQIVTELLKFTSSPIDYVNKGNYVLIASTNNPSDLDKALINRLNKGLYICDGPKTKDQKITLMKRLIEKNVPKDKLKINDWNTIGHIAYKENLSGRELTGCIENLFDQNTNNEFSKSLYAETYEMQLAFFCDYKTITTNSIINELENTIQNKETKNYI